MITEPTKSSVEATQSKLVQLVQLEHKSGVQLTDLSASLVGVEVAKTRDLMVLKSNSEFNRTNPSEIRNNPSISETKQKLIRQHIAKPRNVTGVDMGTPSIKAARLVKRASRSALMPRKLEANLKKTAMQSPSFKAAMKKRTFTASRLAKSFVPDADESEEEIEIGSDEGGHKRLKLNTYDIGSEEMMFDTEFSGSFVGLANQENNIDGCLVSRVFTRLIRSFV